MNFEKFNPFNKKGEGGSIEEAKIIEETTEKIDKKKHSRAEKRREDLQEWEEMSEEGRKEEYGKRYEQAKRLYDLEKTRLETVKLEREINKRSGLSSRIWDKLPWSDKKPLTKMEKDYQEKFREYQEKRDSTVSKNVLATLNQNLRLEEQRALEKGIDKTKFEKIKEGWKWLGDQNLEKVLKKFGKEPESKITKTAARFISARTFVNFSLIGIGFGTGSAALGLTAFASRRVMGGTATAFTSYDFMNLRAEAKKEESLSLSEEKIKEMNVSEIERKMAQIEALHGNNGNNLLKNESYKKLREKYAEEVNSKSELSESLIKMDNVARYEIDKLSKEDRKRKIIASLIGLLTAGVFSTGKIIALFENAPEEIAETYDSSTGETEEEFVSRKTEEIENIYKTTPLTTNEMMEDSLQDETKVNQQIVNTLEKSEFPKVPKALESEAINFPYIIGVPEFEEITEGIEKIKSINTIKDGSNIWNTAKEMMVNGDITEKEFWEAWGNPESAVEFPSGEKIHISDAGLSHAGDQVIFVPGENGEPGHFEVVDFAKDKFNLGDNRDLYQALKSQGKEIPRWLKEALNIEEIGVTKLPETDIQLGNWDVNNLQDLNIDEKILEQTSGPAREITGFIEDKGNGKFIIKGFDEFEKIKIEFNYNPDGSIENMDYKMKGLSDKTPEETFKILRRIQKGFYNGTEEYNFVRNEVFEKMKELPLIKNNVLETFNVSPVDIDKAAEIMNNENFKTVSFDGMDSVERLTPEEIVERIKNWDAVNQLTEKTAELYEESIVKSYGDGAFEVPENDRFKSMFLKFEYDENGIAEGLTFREDAEIGETSKLWMDEVREEVFLTADPEKINLFELSQKKLEAYPRLLQTLPKESTEYAFVRERFDSLVDKLNLKKVELN
ncbi:MAG: hypothetical protein WDZ80_05155 [Candidatus Paceibacterota bacterium]